MARLDSGALPIAPSGLAAASVPISASAQFGAIAYLRWRLFANAFRRKEGAGELAARVIVYPVGLLFLLGPTAGALFGSYAAVSSGHIGLLSLIFWLIFLLQVLVSVNLSPAALSFDTEALIRFPLSFSRYLTIRLFLGLLAPSTIAGTCSLLAAAAGATAAIPTLAPIVFPAAIALALSNIFFVRMVYAWVDRWLSTRRARELFTGVLILFGIGVQYANVTFNNLGHHQSRAVQAAKVAAVARFYHHAQPALAFLPPGLAGAAVFNNSLQHTGPALLQIAGVLVWAAFFLAVFASRMAREYRGENLSEANVTPLPPAKSAQVLVVALHPEPETRFGLSPVLTANLEKEFLYLRRNISQFYGFLAPIAMVFLFAGRLGSFGRNGFVLPSAVAYCFLGIAALAYNILGTDATGIQSYLLAPIRMRTVFLAKNLFGFALSAVQLILVFLVVSIISGPPPVWLALATIAWVVFATFSNAAVGNIRSITTPKKMDPNKISRRQASQLSALMSIGIMLAAAGIGAGLILLARSTSLPWLPFPVLLALAAGAVLVYLRGLDKVDALIVDHREILLEELCKAS